MKKQYRLINKGKGLAYIEVDNLEEVTPVEDLIALIDTETNKRVLKEDGKSIVSNTEIAKLLRLNNTTDAEKPVSDAQAIADNLRLLKGDYLGDAKSLDNSIKAIDIKVNGIISSVDYGGSIVPTDTPDIKYAGKNVYWKATQAGVYTNFGNKEVLANSDATISRVDGVFTISQTPSDLSKYTKISEITQIVYGTNMFNKAAAIDNKTLVTATGALTDTTGWFTSDFIQVTELTNYISNLDFTFLCFYDVDKVFLSGITEAGKKSITTLKNARWVRISKNGQQFKGTLQIEKGTISTPYVPFTNGTEGYIFVKGDELDNYTKKSELKQLVYGLNMFGQAKAVNDKSLNTLTGGLNDTVGWFTSDFIQVDELTNYVANLDFTFICFYNIDKIFISSINSVGQKNIFTVANAKWFRVSKNGQQFKETLQIEKGILSTTYVPFVEPVEGYIFVREKDLKTDFSLVPSDKKVASEKLTYSVKKDLDRSVYFDETNIFDKLTVNYGFFPSNLHGQLVKQPDFCSSDYMKVEPLTTYTRNKTSSFTAFYDINKVFISGIAVAGTYSWTTPANCYYVRAEVKVPYIDTLQIQKGTKVTPYMSFKEPLIKYNTIVATRNAADFNSIREIMANITDATYSNRYIIYVPNGEWFECDIIGKRFVEIVGQNKRDTILYSDGTSTKLTPQDYSFGQGLVALNTVPRIYKHCINVVNNVKVSNVTIRVKEGKYCVHCDNSIMTETLFTNCIFISEEEVNYPVGVGMWSGQSLIFKGCEFRSTSDANKLGLFVHNSLNQDKPTYFKAENCQFTNTGYILVDEIGSNQPDIFELINCYSTIDGVVSWYSEGAEDPSTLPYCISLNVFGTPIYDMNSIGGRRDNFLASTTGYDRGFKISKNTTAPATLTSVGVKNEVRVTTTGVYYCIDTNTWKYVPFN